jgi:hypothetical protein
MCNDGDCSSCVSRQGQRGARGPTQAGPTGPTGPTGTDGAEGLLLNPKQLALLKWVPNQNDPRTVFTIPGVNTSSNGACYDGEFLWMNNTASTYYKFSTITRRGVTGTVPITGTVGTPVFDGVFIWYPIDNNLVKILASTGVVSATYNYPGLSNFSNGSINVMCGCFDGTNIWFTTASTPGLISKITPSTGALVTTYPTGGDLPCAPYFDGENIWIRHIAAPNDVTKLDINTGLIIDTYSGFLAAGNITSDGLHAWIANNSSGGTTRITLNDNTRLDLAIGSNGSVMFDQIYIWTSNNTTVNKIDINSGQLLGSYTVVIGPALLVFDSTYSWLRQAIGTGGDQRFQMT